MLLFVRRISEKRRFMVKMQNLLNLSKFKEKIIKFINNLYKNLEFFEEKYINDLSSYNIVMGV